MIPGHYLASSRSPSSSPGAPDGLRAYLRDEWNAEIGWVYASLERSGPIGRGRLGSWVRRLWRRAVEGRSRRPGPVSPGPVTIEQGTERPECAHPALEDLGFGGFATFARCALCGAVVVSSRGQVWVVPSATVPRSEPEESGAAVETARTAEVAPEV